MQERRQALDLESPQVPCGFAVGNLYEHLESLANRRDPQRKRDCRCPVPAEND